MNCVKIINSLVDLVKDNKNILDKLNQEDNEVFEFKFDINQLIKILSEYKNSDILLKQSRKIFISHYGNPYVTAMLCMEAMVNQTELVIGIEDICYGINKSIIKMVDDVFKEYRIPIQIELKNNVTNQEIEEMSFDKIICLGNSNSYTNFRKFKNVTVEYVPFFNISVYYDLDEYEELAENIRYYATQNFYEIEIFDETEEFEDVIYSMNHSKNTDCAVILSQDKEKQNKFQQEINAKIICVNENPFQKLKLKISEEIWGWE